MTTFETATWGRRMLALLVDWFASTLVVVLVVGLDAYSRTGSPAPFYVLGVFVVESALLTATVGGSFGQVATRLRVVRANGDPRPVDVPRALLRQVLIALVIPPLVYRPDGRGLHDLAAASATVTLQTYRALSGRSVS
ncbi:RDD family protein [Nocardioides sp. SYSU D00038]|uniref:RDD family protein n=1 Tax=Nocardioides sp. SYSU D00038 TaxID=2812554 RepID=UPI0027DC9ADA|nr:RDD family protein [Nocardioides sp. SYSU D00038]